MSKKTILQVINSAARGGGTVHLWNLITNLDRTKYNIHIAISSDGPYVEEFRKKGFEVHVIEMMSRKVQKRSIRELFHLASELKPDLIHAHGTRAAFYMTRAFKKKKPCPLIYTAHTLSYNRDASILTRAFYRQVERSICEHVDHVISVSETDGEEIVTNEVVDKKKLSIIPNGIDIDRFLALKPAGKNRNPLGTVARLIDQKGIQYLIEALYILEEAFGIKADLIIVGDGPLKSDLQRMANNLGVNNRISWIGTVPDTLPYYKKIKTFVQPSLLEGLSLVLIEAMASGVPVIATDTSAGKDLIRDGKNGIMVRRGDSEALALAIKELLDNPAPGVKFADQARKDVKEKYRLDKFVKSTEAVYKKAIDR